MELLPSLTSRKISRHGSVRRQVRCSSNGTRGETACGAVGSRLRKSKQLGSSREIEERISRDQSNRMGLAPAQTDIMESVQAGADGFILKDAKVEDVIYTIRAVAAGKTVLPTPMTGSLFFQSLNRLS